MEQQNYELSLLFEVPNVELFEYSNGSSKLLQRGALGVYELRSFNLVVLRLDAWQYSLDVNLPVLAQHGGSHKRIFIFPKAAGQHYGVVISDANQDLYDCWVSVLSNHTNYAEGALRTEAQTVEYAKSATPEQKEKELGAAAPADNADDEHSTSRTIGHYLSIGGDAIKEGLIAGAKLLQEGIISAGEYIQTKITKPEPTQISQETVVKVKMANVASKGMLVYTQVQVKALILGAKEIAGAAAGEVSSSETAKKVQEHKYYPDAKNIAIGTVHGVAAVYEGMFEAMCCVARGFQVATAGVVAKKYGTQAGSVVNEGMDAVGNVGQLGGAAKNAALREAQVLTDPHAKEAAKGKK
jgi:spartin